MRIVLIFTLAMAVAASRSQAGDVDARERIELEFNGNELNALLGLPRTDSQLRGFVTRLGKPDAKYRSDGYQYLDYNDKGIQLQFDGRAKLVGIRLRGGAAIGIIFKVYEGKVPFGLSVRDRRSEVIRKLGLPDQEMVFSNGAQWVNYVAIGVSIQFAPPTVQEPNARIEEIVLSESLPYRR